MEGSRALELRKIGIYNYKLYLTAKETLKDI